MVVDLDLNEGPQDYEVDQFLSLFSILISKIVDLKCAKGKPFLSGNKLHFLQSWIILVANPKTLSFTSQVFKDLFLLCFPYKKL